MFNPFFIFNH